MPTLTAVFLITVVHAVKHVIAAPTPRDTVSTIQTKELILPALLHTANLSAKIHRKSSKLSLSVTSHWMIHVLTYSRWIHNLINSSSPLNYCTLKRKHIFWFAFFKSFCTDLVWAIQTVVMSITPQAGWHTPSTGTHILVDRTCRDSWKRVKCISQQPTFSQLEVTQMRPF